MFEKSKTAKHQDLIFDVGMHKGEDTDFYLTKGFNVVAIEANPDLVSECRKRFADQIQKGRLTIIEGAISDLDGSNRAEGKVNFYRNKDNTTWSTVSNKWASRTELEGTSNEVIEAPIVDFSEVIKNHGIPYYMKIDIEGMDQVCLEALRDFEIKPDFVSIESEKVCFSKLYEEIDLLQQLGYRQFKAIQQLGISKQREPVPSHEIKNTQYRFREGSSGLFGRDLPGKWKSHSQIISTYRCIFILYKLFGEYGKFRKSFALRKYLSKILRRPIPGWYDTHAKQ